jgi:hypothetical protein
MPPLQIPWSPVGAALLTLTLVSACSTSSDGAAPFQAPPLDPRDEKPCYDPGVGEEAITSLGQHRVALADCRKKHENVVKQYNQVRQDLSKKGPI